jgi:hypothetical protein
MTEKISGTVDLHLGRWFLIQRQDRKTEADETGKHKDQGPKRLFVPFGEKLVLHPGRFILGATLEWVRLPMDIAGQIVAVAEDGEAPDAVEAIAESGAPAAEVDPPAEAASINARVEGWRYRIPTYQFDQMTRRMSDLLKAEEESPAPEAE